MILGHMQIKGRLKELFPDTPPYKIGAASADVRIGREVMNEDGEKFDLDDTSEDKPRFMLPGQFLLAEMLEYTKVPNDLSCMFLLKSTLARMGMSHSFAGWIDPGWQGHLTMELKNYNQFKRLAVWQGMPIGQLIYMQTWYGGEYGGRYQDSFGVVGPREEVDYDPAA